MCGIAGITSNSLDRNDVFRRVAKMQRALQHRGPDDYGEFHSPVYSSSLAHTRLSIIDLSASGHQPMSSLCGRYVITYNGEIYNYQDLRQQLESKGEKFQSNSDTEVILKLYQNEGANCLKLLRGMFAFFIWDEQDKTGFAARDPLGIKPLYYYTNNNTFAFSSELKSLIKSELVTNTLSSSGLFSYFKTGTVSEPDTILDNAKMLEAGSYLTWNNGKFLLNKYSSLDFTPSNINHEGAIKITRSALEDSIKAHFVSDVPVGLFLSGGIDSTAILALAKKVSDAPIRTYSIAFQDPEWNEGDIAKRVAEHFGSLHTELVMTQEIAQSLFKQFLNSIDQPTIDGFNTFCVAKLAHDHGEKVVLSGIGGDELFAGYKSFELIPRMVAISKTFNLLSQLLKFFSGIFNRFLSSKMRRVLDFMSSPGSSSAAHQSLRGIYSNTEALALTEKYGLSPLNTINAEEIETNSLLDTISKLELTTYMRNQLLRDSDVMSMAWSLELRVPFVDFKLVQTLAKIPASIRLKQGKKLLTESVPEIPQWVIDRPKQGFSFPFDQWFSDSWSEQNLSITPPSWIHLTPWYRRWSLVVLDGWIKRHN